MSEDRGPETLAEALILLRDSTIAIKSAEDEAAGMKYERDCALESVDALRAELKEYENGEDEKRDQIETLEQTIAEKADALEACEAKATLCDQLAEAFRSIDLGDLKDAQSILEDLRPALRNEGYRIGLVAAATY